MELPDSGVLLRLPIMFDMVATSRLAVADWNGIIALSDQAKECQNREDDLDRRAYSRNKENNYFERCEQCLQFLLSSKATCYCVEVKQKQ